MNGPEDDALPPLDWDELFRVAEERLAKVLGNLPDELQREAEQIPCVLEKWPDDSLEPDTLGFYPYFEEDRISPERGPILLYLGSIFTVCEYEGTDFGEEVETTYLHELGHHLGLDEDDLRDRGLE